MEKTRTGPNSIWTCSRLRMRSFLQQIDMKLAFPGRIGSIPTETKKPYVQDEIGRKSARLFVDWSRLR